ncbi:MAG: efflux RND transporter periplasmic adaptor subunit [Verrucomicrobiota bacterium]
MLLPFAFLTLSSCKKEEAVAPVVPRTVITFLVPDSSDTQERRFSGQTEATTSVELGFQVSGRISQIFAETGRRYRAGELLAKLDPDLNEANLQTARAQALQATQELRRTQELFESGNASKASFDAAIANQKAAEATLKSAELNVQYTTLTMPYDGFISSVPADVNQVVSVGSPVVNIQSELGMDFEVGIPTSLISKVAEGQKASIVLTNLPDQKLTATVTEVSPLAAENTTYPVTLRIENSTDFSNLRADMDGEAIFQFPKAAGAHLAAPISAVQTSPDGNNYLWLVDDPSASVSTVTQQAITVGDLASEGLISVTSGLESGQTIVAKGVSHLSQGMQVTPQ